MKKKILINGTTTNPKHLNISKAFYLTMCWENGLRNTNFLTRLYLKKQHKKNKKEGLRNGTN